MLPQSIRSKYIGVVIIFEQIQKTKLDLEKIIKLPFNNIEVAQFPQSNVWMVALKILKKILCSPECILGLVHTSHMPLWFGHFFQGEHI